MKTKCVKTIACSSIAAVARSCAVFMCASTALAQTVVPPPVAIAASSLGNETGVKLAPEFGTGAICSVHFEKGGQTGRRVGRARQEGGLKDLLPKLKAGSIPSLAKFYDNDATGFEKNVSADKNTAGVKYNIIKWEGYLKIKKAGKYSFMLGYPVVNQYDTILPGQFRPECALVINDQEVVVAKGDQDWLHLDLKSGMNKFSLVTLPGNFSSSGENAKVYYHPCDSMEELREIRPNDIFHCLEGKSGW